MFNWIKKLFKPKKTETRATLSSTFINWAEKKAGPGWYLMEVEIKEKEVLAYYKDKHYNLRTIHFKTRSK